MNILIWHVHGSWLTSFLSGTHEYLLPVTAGRGCNGRGRADSWEWPATTREVTPRELRHEPIDVVILQRPHDAELTHVWTGRRPGRDVPAIYLEHNAPTGHAVTTRHPSLDDPWLADSPMVHVTHFNDIAWDCGDRRTVVIEHGIPDPGPLWTGDDPSLAVVVNEPVRRWRVVGSDLVLRLVADLPLHVYGIDSGLLPAEGGGSGLSPAACHDLCQRELHSRMAQHRAYLHPFRWTSLGLALIEAMTIGMPVLALATTAVPESVPPTAGCVSNDVSRLRDTARRWLRDPDEAREVGAAARAHALDHFGITRFLSDWDRLLKEESS